MPDALASLAADLRALPRRKRRAVVESLSPPERAKLKLLLSCAGAEPAPKPGPEVEASPFSPPVAERLSGESDPRSWAITPAAAHALRQAAAAVSESAAVAVRRDFPRRSLVGAFGDLLAQGGRRR